MRIYTKAGDLAFKTFTFPDGQPHFKLETTGDDSFQSATVEMALKSPADLFLLAMVVQVLREQGFTELCLDVRYLLGARMDRAISPNEPFTLQVVARYINSLGLAKVRILDAHSEVATRLIKHSWNVLPTSAVQQVVNSLPGITDIIIPDKGASDRVHHIMAYVRGGGWIHQCHKQRDPATGKLSNFVVPSEGLRVPDGVLIVDDICDGGGTFVGLAAELKKHGAKKVYLFVTHGIFSKGVPLEGVEHIYTTDSYSTGETPVNTRFSFDHYVTRIPVSMKEMP